MPAPGEATVPSSVTPPGGVDPGPGASDPAGAGPIYDLGRHTLIVKPWDAEAKALAEPMARIDVNEVYSALEATLDSPAAS